MATWSCDACGAYPDDLWAACPACLELRPVGTRWPSTDLLIVLYPGDTQVDAAARYRTQAAELARVGFTPLATSWGQERPSAGAAMLAAHLEEAYRVGTLLVTYRGGVRT
jgi:hypothetical protein